MDIQNVIKNNINQLKICAITNDDTLINTRVIDENDPIIDTLVMVDAFFSLDSFLIIAVRYESIAIVHIALTKLSMLYVISKSNTFCSINELIKNIKVDMHCPIDPMKIVVYIVYFLSSLLDTMPLMTAHIIHHIFPIDAISILE